ncbi:hypothetical protein KUCAC02_022011, partial [Chaenocephalus aceratus]
RPSLRARTADYGPGSDECLVRLAAVSMVSHIAIPVFSARLRQSKHFKGDARSGNRD